jgi:hypothetical protein
MPCDKGVNIGRRSGGCFARRLTAKGHTTSWTGYELHVDTADGDIPISCLLTSASVHDSQAALALATMKASRVTNLCDLMDSAYDAPEIRAKSRAARARSKPRRRPAPDDVPVTNSPSTSATISVARPSASMAT